MIVLNRYDIVEAGWLSFYPNGEAKLEIPDKHVLPSGNEVVMYWRSDADLIHLIMVARHIHVHRDPGSRLTIAYMPYSRLDRVKEGDQVFTLRYVCDLINSLGFRRVRVVEPHSDVCLGMLDNATPIWIVQRLLSYVFRSIAFDQAEDYLVFPDAGAAKRYAELGYPNVLVGNKHRDFGTGKLSRMTLSGDKPDPERRPKALVIDDLCSYGGTFVLAHDALRVLGFQGAHLFVAHAEPAISDGQVFDFFDSVHATDSLAHDDPRITTYRLGTLL